MKNALNQRNQVIWLALFVCLSATLQVSAEPVGQATRIQRFAYQTPINTNRQALYRFGAIHRDAVLETVTSGALQATFLDGSVLTLGSSSKITVDKFVYTQSDGDQQTIKLTQGLFRFISGNMPKSKVRLLTPTVSIGIRGTTLKIRIKADGAADIFFEHGQGFVEDMKGGKVDVAEGELLQVASDGTFSQPRKTVLHLGDHAVDQGLQAFGSIFGGPGAGSGGSGASAVQSGPRDAASP